MYHDSFRHLINRQCSINFNQFSFGFVLVDDWCCIVIECFKSVLDRFHRLVVSAMLEVRVIQRTGFDIAMQMDVIR